MEEALSRDSRLEANYTRLFDPLFRKYPVRESRVVARAFVVRLLNWGCFLRCAATGQSIFNPEQYTLRLFSWAFKTIAGVAVAGCQLSAPMVLSATVSVLRCTQRVPLGADCRGLRLYRSPTASTTRTCRCDLDVNTCTSAQAADVV
jgi:hypothetical protein